jgi:short-subunit dehydrogenase
MQIKDKVIIVTGASMGIGLETAKLLAKEGAKVVVAARSKEKIDALAKELPDSLSVPTDMTKESDIQNLLDATLKKYGRIDVLINNAGQGIYGLIENVNTDEYRKIFELNVVAPLIAMQKVIPIMRKQGGGTIVNISSMVSKNYIPMIGAYASTKYALNALSLTARAELAKDNIVVSIMLPTLTDTDFGKNAVKSDEMSKYLETRFQANRPQPDTAEYIAERIKLTIESGEAEIFPRDEMVPNR